MKCKQFTRHSDVFCWIMKFFFSRAKYRYTRDFYIMREDISAATHFSCFLWKIFSQEELQAKSNQCSFFEREWNEAECRDWKMLCPILIVLESGNVEEGNQIKTFIMSRQLYNNGSKKFRLHLILIKKTTTHKQKCFLVGKTPCVLENL